MQAATLHLLYSTGRSEKLLPSEGPMTPDHNTGDLFICSKFAERLYARRYERWFVRSQSERKMAKKSIYIWESSCRMCDSTIPFNRLLTHTMHPFSVAYSVCGFGMVNNVLVRHKFHK